MQKPKARSKPRSNHPTYAAFIGRVEPCQTHGAHVTDLRIVADDVELAYEAPDADAVISNSVGWSQGYADGWDRIFGGSREVN